MTVQASGIGVLHSLVRGPEPWQTSLCAFAKMSIDTCKQVLLSSDTLGLHLAGGFMHWHQWRHSGPASILCAKTVKRRIFQKQEATLFAIMSASGPLTRQACFAALLAVCAAVLLVASTPPTVASRAVLQGAPRVALTTAKAYSAPHLPDMSSHAGSSGDIQHSPVLFEGHEVQRVRIKECKVSGEAPHQLGKLRRF
jgi:hypothetical protein